MMFGGLVAYGRTRTSGDQDRGGCHGGTRRGGTPRSRAQAGLVSHRRSPPVEIHLAAFGDGSPRAIAPERGGGLFYRLQFIFTLYIMYV